MAFARDSRRRLAAFRRRSRLIAGGLGVLALLAFTGAAWTDGFGFAAVRGLVIALSAAMIALFAARGRGWRGRMGTAALGGLFYWPVLFTIGAVVILAKSGEFHEGGPIGLALVIGAYLAAPILILATALAPLLGLVLDRGRQALSPRPPPR